MATPLLLNIRGLRDFPSIKDVNVRSGANTSYTLLFKTTVGTGNLPVQEVKADDQNANQGGKVYQWLRVAFPDGQSGWVRDDLVEVFGDGRPFGYPLLAQPTPPFILIREARPLTITVRGIASAPEVNVRAGANTSYPLIFKVLVGTTNILVKEARADEQGANLNGKVYNWFRATFPNGLEGWVRDDLVEIAGNGTPFGYPLLTLPALAFEIPREGAVVPPPAAIPAPPPVLAQPPAPAPVPQPIQQPPPPAFFPPPPPVVVAQPPAPQAAPLPPVAPLAGDTPERVRRAAFNMTSAFEGGGYATYQTFDKGIVSYGRFQFTLDAGSFVTVMTRYTERSNAPIAGELRGYFPRFQVKDEGLRKDARLKELCVAAAQDPIMQAVQDEVALEGFYKPVVDLSINPRGLVLPLSFALIYDIAINHGRFSFLIPKTEEVLGVPAKSKVGQNGVSEQQFITKLAQLRQENLAALAVKFNFGGLKRRGDFWMGIVNAGDWLLQGDASGAVNINGKIVQVRNP